MLNSTTKDNLDKVALLNKVAPLFPRGELPDCTESLYDDAFLKWERDIYEQAILPYWVSLAPAYKATLAIPFGQDTSALMVEIEHWPADFHAQQADLYKLMHVSQLRESWRNLCQWTDKQSYPYSDDQRAQLLKLEHDFSNGNRTIKEIPLYQGFIRASCQQLICMPTSTWEAMMNDGCYEPGNVDTDTVERLATRVAQVFNTPPLAPLSLMTDSPSWLDPVVWASGQRQLTAAINQHGMRDRLEDEYGHLRESTSNHLFPEWRFDGFYGRLRVVLENGDEWTSIVLAPRHFVRRLMFYPEWHVRAAIKEGM